MTGGVGAGRVGLQEVHTWGKMMFSTISVYYAFTLGINQPDSRRACGDLSKVRGHEGVAGTVLAGALPGGTAVSPGCLRCIVVLA